MAISFTEIPNTVRTPFVFVEFDPTKAQQGPILQRYTALHVGYRTSAGTISELVPKLVTSPEQSASFFGNGSMLHLMARSWFRNNRTVELWQVALNAPAGVANTWTVTVGGTATAGGTVYLWVNGELIQVGVANGDTANTVATNINTEVQKVTSLPFTSSVVAPTVTLTAKHQGVAGNALDVRANYREGQSTPAGITLTIANQQIGTGTPESGLTTLWPVIEPTQYHVVAVGFQDTGSLDNVKAQMAARANAMRAQEGMAVIGARVTHANLVTLASARNSAYLTLLGADGAPQSPPEWGAAYAAHIAGSGQNDPARPFKTLHMAGILPPLGTLIFTQLERDILLHNGAATWYEQSGDVRIERAVTTYLTNALGAADTAFLQVNSPLTLSYIRFATRTRFAVRYPRHKLGQDSKRYGAGQAIMTPNRARAEFLSLFQEWEELAIVEDFQQFKRDLIVEIDPADPNRLNVILPPNIVNQFEILGVKLSFLL